MSEQIASSEPIAGRAVRTAVAGVGGYAGAELARLLLAHPRLQQCAPLFLGRVAESDAPGAVMLEDLHPQLARGAGKGGHRVQPFDWHLIEERGIDVVFLALPHETSRAWAPEWIERGIRVVDLSGAWRLHEQGNRAVYSLHDEDEARAAALQQEAVFGCPEINAEAIRSARLVANPGCYSTSIILALLPLLRAGLVDLDHGIVCDAKSGISGAGKTPSAKTHFMYGADNLSAYNVFGHRHLGEMYEQLHLTAQQIQFTPHLLPIPRGILSTIYLRLRAPADAANLEATMRDFYAQSPMVRVRKAGDLPQIQHVVRTNFCDLGFALAPDRQRLVLVSCLDNLLKGASGQAVQNLNLMCGWKQEEGLL